MTERNWWCGLPILIEQPAHRAPGGESLKHFIGSKSLQLLAPFSGAVKSRTAKPRPGATDYNRTFVLAPRPALRSPDEIRFKGRHFSLERFGEEHGARLPKTERYRMA